MRLLARRRDDRVERSIVWLLGSPRTGSTWLLNLLSGSPSARTLDEPLIGAHLGVPAAAALGSGGSAPAGGWRALDVFADRDDYVFAAHHRPTWEPPLRALLLARLGAALQQRGGRAGRDLLVVKEPNGSEAADVLSRLLPQSRLLVLLRDGRDVVDSLLDAVSPGAWASALTQVEDEPAQRLRFLCDASSVWTERMRIVRAALDAHAPERTLVLRYEDLLERTQPEVERVLEWMRAPVPDGLPELVQRLSFGNVAADAKGSGRFHRAATPGLWRQRLTAEEQSAVQSVMGPTLTELGYS